MKINMNNKKTNLIITSAILIVVLAIGIYTSIRFIQFRNYETEFITDKVDEVIKFHEYSKHLEGTIGDSDIYVINGSENTVLLVKSDSQDFTSVESLSSKRIASVAGTTQNDVAKAKISGIIELETASSCVEGLKANSYDGVILSYQAAKEAVKNDTTLKISSLEVEKVPSMLVIGGTHPNEPSGQLAATVLLENASVERGILYIVTELNKSAFSFSQPQEATTWFYHLTTKNGTTRTFKFGSRATNTVDQWPTPDVYTHSSGQQLSSSEVRNINRAYPGNENGNYTEQIAYAITNFVNKKDVTIVIDLHEASPEYLTIDAGVYHQDSVALYNKIRIKKLFSCTQDGFKVDPTIKFDPSPENMHGLTHREIGDYTNAYVFLFETSNAAQGKLRGAFTESLITYEKEDKFYEAAVAYDKENGTELIYGRPVSIDERVARHTLAIEAVAKAFNVNGGVTRTVEVSKIGTEGTGGVAIGDLLFSVPSYIDINNNGVGYYLQDSRK